MASRRAVILLIGAVALIGGVARSARADCDAGIKALREQAAGVTNPRVRTLVEYDIQRANRESAEGDEDECIEALDHAGKLLLRAR